MAHPQHPDLPLAQLLAPPPATPSVTSALRTGPTSATVAVTADGAGPLTSHGPHLTPSADASDLPRDFDVARNDL